MSDLSDRVHGWGTPNNRKGEQKWDTVPDSATLAPVQVMGSDKVVQNLLGGSKLSEIVAIGSGPTVHFGLLRRTSPPTLELSVVVCSGCGYIKTDPGVSGRTRDCSGATLTPEQFQSPWTNPGFVCLRCKAKARQEVRVLTQELLVVRAKEKELVGRLEQLSSLSL